MEDSCPANIYMFKVNNTKTRQIMKYVKGYDKDTGARSIDAVLVPLLLTLNIFCTGS